MSSKARTIDEEIALYDAMERAIANARAAHMQEQTED
jgi:hypothetical protein